MNEDRRSEGRLDAFVDAAFAFAVTLLVIGGGNVPETHAELRAALASAPAFAVGFALLAMFWHAHVRWRDLDARHRGLSVPISVLLVFLVLVYVYPLRVMAQSLVGYMTGTAAAMSAAELGSLFVLYGLGFTAMAACIAALFATSLRGAAGEKRAVIIGELRIWLMLAVFGVASALLSLVVPWLAPWVYALLPLAIGLFVWRHDWTGTLSEEPPPAAADH